VAKFVERYAEGRQVLEDAVRRWADDVRAGRYPREEHTYAIAPEALAEVNQRLGRE
jgi:ketopantoate hydroxymethyltransferase